MNQYAHPHTASRLHEIVVRSGVPFLLFGLVLTGALALSRTYLLPLLTRVHVQGDVLGADQLAETEQRLNDDLAQAEARRAQLVRPVQDARYDTLKEYKRALLTPLVVQTFLATLLAEADPALDGIVFDHIRVDATTGDVRVHGDVRGIGSRSMTVLAQFVDALRAHPQVHALQTPPFTREEDPVLGFHSPFSFAFVLGNADDFPLAE